VSQLFLAMWLEKSPDPEILSDTGWQSLDFLQAKKRLVPSTKLEYLTSVVYVSNLLDSSKF